MLQRGTQAITVATEANFVSWREQLVAPHCARHVPAIFTTARPVHGGLLSYGASITDASARSSRRCPLSVPRTVNRHLSLLTSPRSREGLSQNGYMEGQSVGHRVPLGRRPRRRMPALIDELVGNFSGACWFLAALVKPSSTPSAHRKYPSATPDGDDPVREGLVASLNRPGGTSAMVYTTELEGSVRKLHKLLPQPIVRRVFCVVSRNAARVKNLTAAAAAQHLQIRIFNASSAPELKQHSRTLRRQTSAVAVAAGPFFNGYQTNSLPYQRATRCRRCSRHVNLLKLVD